MRPKPPSSSEAFEFDGSQAIREFKVFGGFLTGIVFNNSGRHIAFAH